MEGKTKISEKNIIQALKSVEDPELLIDIVNLGLVYRIAIEDAKVTVEMTLTVLGCPAASFLEDRVRNTILSLSGVKEVELIWTFDPPWTPDRLTEEGRDLLAAQGYW
jgi:metal-sulfur cluster biosynthetic enzyme